MITFTSTALLVIIYIIIICYYYLFVNRCHKHVWLARLSEARGVFTCSESGGEEEMIGRVCVGTLRVSPPLLTGRIMPVPGVSHCLSVVLMHKYQTEYIQRTVLLRKERQMLQKVIHGLSPNFKSVHTDSFILSC